MTAIKEVACITKTGNAHLRAQLTSVVRRQWSRRNPGRAAMHMGNAIGAGGMKWCMRK
jgi:hypothetical protein